MRKLVQKLLDLIFKYTGKNEITVGVAYTLPAKKVPDMLDKKFLEDNNGGIEAVIVHHSSTYDNEVTSDWDNIDIYHRSFRMNYTIIVAPITEKKELDKIANGITTDVIKIYDSYYPKRSAEIFYETAEELIGKKFVIGQFISNYVKNTKIETPWRKIGYTLGIEYRDNKIEIRYGRNLREPQAHCYQEGMNTKSIGLLVVGNFDYEAPCGEIWRAAIKAVREIKEVFPNIKILGHCEANGVTKTCPGAMWNMDQFRKDIED